MLKNRREIFSRIGLYIFVVVTALGMLFIWITYKATSDYFQGSLQLLNKDIAQNIAKLSAPFSLKGIDHQKADSVFSKTMLISPNTEVYFLDTLGRVQYYFAPDSLIRERNVPLDKIREYLSDRDHMITNTDPREPSEPKIFSAAPVHIGKEKIGYIYVILVSREYRNVADFVFRSLFGGWATKFFFIIIISTAAFNFLYTSRLQKRYDRVIKILEQFKQGDLNVRIVISESDDFYPIADAFNKMVDLLNRNFDQLKLLEGERKTFLAHISHDLRTPLAVARGYAETLTMDGSTDPSVHADHLNIILSKIAQVERLVLQLFELSKIDAVNFVPAREPFVFSEVLQENLKGILIQAEKKAVRVVCEQCEDLAMINADIGMMERVIQNLLENAIKYTVPNGTIMIKLSKDMEHLQIMIENEGPELAGDIMEWVNSDAEDNVLTRPKGTGLGLALVKKILQLHQFGSTAGRRENGMNYFLIIAQRYHNALKN